MESSNNNTDTESHIMIVIEEDPVNVKNRIIRKFPWFLFSWTTVLVFVFVYADNSNYAYDCKHEIFQWRIMTYHMFHVGIIHIIVNVATFWLFGLYIHMVYHDFVNPIIYIIGVIVSGIAYHIDCDLRQSHNRVVGASGGVCAMIGAVFVISLWRFSKGICELGQDYSIRERIRYSMLKYMLSFIIIFSVLGMVCYDIVMYVIEGDKVISHIAHFGGYISGTFLGIIIITIDTYMIKK